MALRLERVDGLNYAWTTETPVLLNSERYRDFFVEWKSPPLAADQWVGSHFPETRFLASSLKCSLILCLVSQKVLAESTQIESTILCHYIYYVYIIYIYAQTHQADILRVHKTLGLGQQLSSVRSLLVFKVGHQKIFETCITSTPQINCFPILHINPCGH